MCHEDKPESAFALRSRATGELQSHCRACHAAYRRGHYLADRAAYIAREVARVDGYRKQNRALILEYLSTHPCVECGESDPIVLDFDHRDPSAKRLDVSRLANRKRWPQVLAETEKCDVRCASCHRRRTAQQFNWRRARVMAPVTMPAARAAGSVVPPTDQALRTCRVCGVPQPLSEFALKDPSTGARATKCRSCQRAYAKAHYRKNRQRYLDKARARNDVRREAFASFLLAYLREHPCVDCGETDPTTLDFDHRDGAEKVATINALIRAQQWPALLTEIEKCDVRCANCHRRRTAAQFEWTARVGEDSTAA